MITFITHVRVSPQNARAYEEVMEQVAQMVRAHEPGVLHYSYAKSVDEPDTYVVIEVYHDRAAQAAHMQQDWIKSSIVKVLPLFEGKIDIRQYVSPGTEPIPPDHLTLA